MSGVNIVRYLLANNAPLLAQVSAANIAAGIIPIGITLPAIGITQVNASSRNIVAMNEVNKIVTERVQVTVMAINYPSKKAILRLVEAALPNTHGIVDGINTDSIINDVEGPDLDDPATTIFTQTEDFIVRFTR